MQFGGDKPIFLQLAEQLEDGILTGAFPEEGQIPSIPEYASTYKINPATLDAGLLYKKRGVGMFVAQGAQEALRQRRSEAFYQDYIVTLVHKAKGLNLSLEQLTALLKKGYQHVD